MGLTAFNRTVSFAPGSSDTKWVEAELAKFAREELRAAIGAGEGSALHVKAVNGRLGVEEERVVAPGAIVYSFDWVRDATVFALEWLRVAAPKRTGRFSRSFVVIVDGREVPAARVPLGHTALIVDTQPYARKIQVGARGFESRRGFFDAAKRRVQAEFRGLVKVNVQFVRLSDGYRLRGHHGRRKDRAAGAEINYPALQIVSETVVAN